MPSRKEVYSTIDGERDYQDNLPSHRTDGSDHTVGDYLVMLDSYLGKAKDAWTFNPGTVASLKQIRKIAAIAVRCMEEHGAEPR
jgi:hypothetical protein